MNTLRKRFWVEVLLGGATAVAFAATILWPQWIERVFRFDVDRGSGELEIALAVGLLVATLAFAFLARVEWRVSRPQAVL